MADIEPRRAAIHRRGVVRELDRNLGGIPAAGRLVRIRRPIGLERDGRSRRPALVHPRKRIVHRIELRSARQNAGNASQPGYVKAALAERQLDGETLRASDNKLDGVNIRALRVGEPQPPAELDRAPVLVMRKPALQRHIRRAGKAARYPVPRIQRNKYPAKRRQQYQERTQPQYEPCHANSAYRYRKPRTRISASNAETARKLARLWRTIRVSSSPPRDCSRSLQRKGIKMM